MIRVTRLGGKELVVNAEMIRFVEATPDTILSLTNGEKIIVQESVDEVIRRCIEYGRSLRSLAD
ncbi:MAG TPA: flagellar FlbD family protein [Phycisphaerae bacterium]|nr:flagellar FlbD family protein [Phycisphaerae bacterium]HOI56433.1 flagellar FlbD family protein [Phycisphaerae bacterium]